jgi:hypothetical protein
MDDCIGQVQMTHASKDVRVSELDGGGVVFENWRCGRKIDFQFGEK